MFAMFAQDVQPSLLCSSLVALSDTLQVAVQQLPPDVSVVWWDPAHRAGYHAQHVLSTTAASLLPLQLPLAGPSPPSSGGAGSSSSGRPPPSHRCLCVQGGLAALRAWSGEVAVLTLLDSASGGDCDGDHYGSLSDTRHPWLLSDVEHGVLVGPAPGAPPVAFALHLHPRALPSGQHVVLVGGPSGHLHEYDVT